MDRLSEIKTRPFCQQRTRVVIKIFVSYNDLLFTRLNFDIKSLQKSLTVSKVHYSFTCELFVGFKILSSRKI